MIGMRYLKRFEDLNESEIGKEVKRLIALPYNKFVKELKDVVANPRVLAMLAKGKIDGSPKDEMIKSSEIDVTADDLVPTQSELSLVDSLEKMPYFAELIASGHVVSEDNPIIIANGKYIIDGHHRWSTTFMLDPTAKIRAFNLVMPAMDPIDILKIVQLALAVEYGDIKTKKPGPGKDAFELDEKGAVKWVSKNVPESVTDLFDESDIVANILKLEDKRIAGAPDRKFMPQAKATAKKVGADKAQAVANLLKRLESGSVNFKDPIENE